MKVRSVLRHKGAAVVTTGPDISVRAAAHRLKLENIGALVVVEGDRMIGLLAERDIVRALADHGEAALQLPVSALMTRKPATCGPDDKLAHVMGLMTRHRTRHVPVFDGGALCGLISIGDVVKNRLGELEMENSVLREAYIAAR